MTDHRYVARVYTDCGRMIEYSDRQTSKEEDAEVTRNLWALRSIFSTGIVAVPTDNGHSLVPVNRIHVIDLVNLPEESEA